MVLVLTVVIRANIVVPPDDNIHSYYRTTVSKNCCAPGFIDLRTKIFGQRCIGYQVFKVIQLTFQLKMKTAELSRACEKHYQLEQELAFFKIDAKFETLGKIPPPPQNGRMVSNGSGNQMSF